jgi:hypothetical protein
MCATVLKDDANAECCDPDALQGVTPATFLKGKCLCQLHAMFPTEKLKTVNWCAMAFVVTALANVVKNLESSELGVGHAVKRSLTEGAEKTLSKTKFLENAASAFNFHIGIHANNFNLINPFGAIQGPAFLTQCQNLLKCFREIWASRDTDDGRDTKFPVLPLEIRFVEILNWLKERGVLFDDSRLAFGKVIDSVEDTAAMTGMQGEVLSHLGGGGGRAAASKSVGVSVTPDSSASSAPRSKFPPESSTKKQKLSGASASRGVSNSFAAEFNLDGLKPTEDDIEVMKQKKIVGQISTLKLQITTLKQFLDLETDPEQVALLQEKVSLRSAELRALL